MEILSVKNVSKSYKENKVLNNITFHVNNSEIVGLVGPNGAGKTTIMKIISNLLKYDNGFVKICDISTKDNREKYLSKFSSVIESPALYEMLSGYDNINFIRKINNISKETLDETLKFINIGDKINCKVKTYSLGMKQRLALGIALLTEPKLLILDEPTNGLDPSASYEFRKLLLNLVANKDISILISSHILSDMDKLCDRVIFIKDGKIASTTDMLYRVEFKKVILIMDYPQDAIPIISSYNLCEDISVQDDKVIINIKDKNISNLLSYLAKDEIHYSKIDITNNGTEESYNEIYGGE